MSEAFESRVTVLYAMSNGGCSPSEATELLSRYDSEKITREEFDELRKQVGEIHSFVVGLAGALNNPMVKAMLPPNMRGMLGG